MSFHKWGIITVATSAMALAMLRFWPVLIVFCIIAGVATGVISTIIGKDINYLLVFMGQFILIVCAAIATFIFIGRERKRSKLI